MSLKGKILFLLGFKICRKCGSRNIETRGFEGINERYACLDCGYTIYVNC